MTILIVDDHEENRYLLEILLKGNGYDATSAANGIAALERIKAGGIALIISDILMPVMDGFLLCRKVKTDETLSHIPFIFYTATYTGPQDEALAMKIGADRFIQKPCEPDVFTKVVADVMARDTRRHSASTSAPGQEDEVLKLYNERLVKKLERKMVQAEAEIQARQEAEEALRISNTRLRLALASANIGLWDRNNETDDIWFSPEWKRQIGYEDHELPNRYDEWKNRLHPEDQPRILAQVEACLQGRLPDYHAEFRLRHKDGGYRWIDASGKVILGPDQKSKRFMGCHVDITERKRAEDAILESEKKFQTLFDTSPLAISLTEINTGRFVDVNNRFCEIAKYTKDELIGKTSTQLGFFSEDDRKKVIEELTHKGIVQGLPMDFTLRDGSVVSTLMFDVFIQIEGKMFILTKFYDVTEQNQLESQLRQAQKLEAIGQLAGGVAHDLNNLLVPILGYSQLLMDDLSPDNARRKPVDQIISAGLKARDLVHQLLAFSRKQILEYRPVDLNKTITNFEKLLRSTIREDIAIEIRMSPHIRPVMADIGQIEQVIMNLAVNAADAMPGGGKLRIETSPANLDAEYAARHPSVEPGDFTMLAVSDTGCGMDNKIQEHIFEPFFTTKGELGTGLGLATVYGIVKQHGGNIWVYTETGKGTVFKVYLPVSQKMCVEEKTIETASTDLKGSETILLVEDNEEVRHLAHLILDRQGYTVFVAENGAEALAVLESYNGPIHLLLTDVVMPEMNGKEVYDIVSEKYPAVKVLFMSGYPNNVIIHHGVLDKGAEFIQKPFTVQALAAKVREVLEQR